MCGIFWGFYCNNLRECFEALKHRGPDNSSYIRVGNHIFGHHRLAIINLSSDGNQPIVYKDTHLICNGQIYNYKKLYEGDSNELSTDCEIISRMFVDNNMSLKDVAYDLDGDFAFIFLKDDVIYAARDPIGIRPLFYGVNENDEVICMASEVKGIINHPEVKNCYVFPPGHFWNSVDKKFEKYTDIYTTLDEDTIKNDEFMELCDYINKQHYPGVAIKDEPIKKKHTSEESLSVIRNGLENAVRKRIEHSDRPVAFLCSGGLDSSIILALSYEILKNRNMGEEKNMHVFSIQFSNDGMLNSDDAMYAEMLVKEYGVQYTPVYFTWENVKENLEKIVYQIESYDPNTIRASVPMYMLAKYIKENTDYTVILSGEGADELFMGYNIFMKATDAVLANQESERLIRNIHMFDGLRADRCFAAHGLELRMPFLDIDYVRKVFRLNPVDKMYIGGVEKFALREAFSDIKELNSSRIIDRQKERFSDGCGFDYVPMLLKFCSNDTTSVLSEKEMMEKSKYKEIFDKNYYGLEHLIIKRENPEWASKKVGTNDLLGMKTDNIKKEEKIVDFEEELKKYENERELLGVIKPNEHNEIESIKVEKPGQSDFEEKLKEYQQSYDDIFENVKNKMSEINNNCDSIFRDNLDNYKNEYNDFLNKICNDGNLNNKMFNDDTKFLDNRNKYKDEYEKFLKEIANNDNEFKLN